MISHFDRIDALAEGTLSPEEAAQVREHMETCQACRIYWLSLTDVAGDELPPTGLQEKIMQQVRNTPQVSRRRNKAWRTIAAAAACAALIAGVGLRDMSFKPDNGGTADLARNYEQTDGGVATDLPLNVHVLQDETLCQQVRLWLGEQDIPALYGAGTREAYDLTAQQVDALNRAIPTLALPQGELQLELQG